ncbi:MAG: FkbM family methyltransferase [Patescibacteria group bacterium]
MIPRLKSLFHVIKSTKNWLSVLNNHYFGDGNFEARFRNGYKLNATREMWQSYIHHAYLFSLLPSAKLLKDRVEFVYKGKKLKFVFGKWGFDTILEIFATDPYKNFMKIVDPMGKSIVDIGAAFGDTAVYFMLNGAKKVYAFEAFPGFSRLAEENIRENSFANSCEVVPMAVGGVSGEMIINPDLGDMFGANLKPSLTGEKVPIITLQQIVEKFNIKDGYLKIDTEGYEYEIIQNTPVDVLRRFSDILIEYHYGFEGIEPYLKKAGFTISHTGPTRIYMPQLDGESAKNMFTGHILAKRQ